MQTTASEAEGKHIYWPSLLLSNIIHLRFVKIHFKYKRDFCLFLKPNQCVGVPGSVRMHHDCNGSAPRITVLALQQWLQMVPLQGNPYRQQLTSAINGRLTFYMASNGNILVKFAEIDNSLLYPTYNYTSIKLDSSFRVRGTYIKILTSIHTRLADLTLSLKASKH